MEVVYLTEAEIDHEVMLPRIQAGEIEPHCARCKAELKIHRMRDGRIHAIECSKNPNHLGIRYNYKSSSEP